jgi:transposase
MHDYYDRQIHDLPCQDYRVRLHVDVRRFHCSNAVYGRRTFVEPVPVVWLYPRRSRRIQGIQDIHAQVDLALGGGARLLAELRIQSCGACLT